MFEVIQFFIRLIHEATQELNLLSFSDANIVYFQNAW